MIRSSLFSVAAILLSLPVLRAVAQDASSTPPPTGTPATEPPKAEAPPAYKWSPPAQEALEASRKDESAKAFSIASKAAKDGDTDCQFLLGRMYENGTGTKTDAARALEQYRAAAEKGQLEAKSNWARCLEFGIGVKSDPEKADFLWQQAAEAGFPSAQSRMGLLEVDAIRRPKNDIAAREWFEKAAAQGDAEALYRLSQCYQHGWGGLPQDVTKALENVLKAANGGNLDAVNQVGMYYQHGYGLRQDKVAAAGWFNFAAEYEHPAALANLGQCYEAGQGVKPNQETAAKLFAGAAKKNDAVGCLYLARCFLDGRGVARNPVFAFVNFSRAADLGLKGSEKQRDDVKTQLSPAQLKEAERLLKEIAGTAGKSAAPAPEK